MKPATPRKNPPRRAPGTKVLNVPMSEGLYDDLKKMADRHEAPLATFVRAHLMAFARKSRAARRAVEIFP